MSSNTGGEGEIRKNLITNDLVECMVALPGQLFFNTQIPVCLWFLRKQKKRKGEVLFIDARNLGFMADRTRREFTDADIEKIASTYHAWRADDFAPKNKDYGDIKGFCKSATLAEIKENDYVLTPGRYVGIAETEEDDEAFSTKMSRLTKDLQDQMAQSAELDRKIKENLERYKLNKGEFI
jgi:type I restriction enzyme M protein